MRLSDNGVQLTFIIPVGKPDCNGVMYTPEAIENALKNVSQNLPIVYRGNESDAQIVVGSTTSPVFDTVWDAESGCCIVKIDGKIYYGGANIIVNDIKDGIVTDFEFVSFGISK